MDRSATSPVLDDDGDDRDQVVVLRGVSWESYEALLASRPKRDPRMAYLDGTLELMTTSGGHELDKKLLARLVEAYAEAADIELNAEGSKTLRKKIKKAGIEPDECYCVGPIATVLHLAIEVVHTSGGVDKLEIYRRLGVGEVWFWIERRVRVYELVEGRYVERSRSAVLQGIDLDELTRLCDHANKDRQTTMIRSYREAVSRRRRKSAARR